MIHTFCFFCSVCRIVCVSVDISLNIRGYFITYPWIFHYVSTVTRVFCFVLAIYWLYILGFSHIGGFVFTHTNLTDLTKYSFIAGFFFHAKRSSPPEPLGRWPKGKARGQRQSREKREDFFHRWIFGLTQISRISQMARRFARACRPRRVFAHRMVHASETMRAS